MHFVFASRNRDFSITPFHVTSGRSTAWRGSFCVSRHRSIWGRAYVFSIIVSEARYSIGCIFSAYFNVLFNVPNGGTYSRRRGNVAPAPVGDVSFLA